MVWFESNARDTFPECLGCLTFCVGVHFVFFAGVAVADKDERKERTSAKGLYAL
jgi:hypothetical protein